MITDLHQLDPEARYTHADYLLWRFPERVELINGRIQLMGTPNGRHQRIAGKLQRAFSQFLQNLPSDVYAAPFDVRLPRSAHQMKSHQVDTVVQPDICVVCDRERLDGRGCLGAPDLIVEILSPGNCRNEMRDKYELYQAGRVTEYWVVFPAEQVLQRYILNAGHIYQAQPPNVEGDVVDVTFLPGFELAVGEIFQE